MQIPFELDTRFIQSPPVRVFILVCHQAFWAYQTEVHNRTTGLWNIWSRFRSLIILVVRTGVYLMVRGLSHPHTFKSVLKRNNKKVVAANNTASVPLQYGLNKNNNKQFNTKCKSTWYILASRVDAAFQKTSKHINTTKSSSSFLSVTANWSSWQLPVHDMSETAPAVIANTGVFSSFATNCLSYGCFCCGIWNFQKRVGKLISAPDSTHMKMK